MNRIALLLCALVGACAPRPSPPDSATSTSYVDSIFPIEEELRRFRATLTEAPVALEGGASSREELVRHFLGALERQDTVAINAMVLSRGEFAYLYYPSTPYVRPPYEMGPSLLWFIGQERGHKGIVRALRRYGGRPLGYLGHRCDPEPRREGENLLWSGCTLQFAQAPGDTGEVRLFGSIVERDARFKFVSYANPL